LPFFKGLHSEVNVPGLLLRCDSHTVPPPVRPFGSTTVLRPGGATPDLASAASSPQARCGSSRTVPQAATRDLHFPSGVFASLRIKAFNRSRCLPARLTISPDRLSLPDAVSISSVGFGSPFLARRSLFFQPELHARNGLSLTRNDCPFRSHHSGVKVPGLLLRCDTYAVPAARSALRLHYRLTPRERYSRIRRRLLRRLKPVAALPAQFRKLLLAIPTPSWEVLPPSRSKRSTALAVCQPA
jgi:hypothetical protein